MNNTLVSHNQEKHTDNQCFLVNGSLTQNWWFSFCLKLFLSRLDASPAINQRAAISLQTEHNIRVFYATETGLGIWI